MVKFILCVSALLQGCFLPLLRNFSVISSVGCVETEKLIKNQIITTERISEIKPVICKVVINTHIIHNVFNKTSLFF